jgi:hypothetical protein
MLPAVSFFPFGASLRPAIAMIPSRCEWRLCHDASSTMDKREVWSMAIAFHCQCGKKVYQHGSRETASPGNPEGIQTPRNSSVGAINQRIHPLSLEAV